MNKKIFMSVAVLSLSFVGLSSTAVTPAIASFTTAFPDIPASIIMMIATITSLMMVPGNLLSGMLTPKHISFRKMLTFAFLLMTVSGIAPFFINNFYVILIMRAVFGFSLGLVSPLAPSLMFSLFDKSTVATLMGFSSVVTNVGAIVFQMVGGILCVISWQYTFLVHLIILFVLAIVLIWLPNPPAVPISESKTSKDKIPAAVWGIALGMGILMLLMMPVSLNISLIIESGGMGNAATAGFALTMNTVGGVLAGLIFGQIFKKAKAFTLSIGTALIAIGFACVFYASTITMIIVGLFISGFGVSLVMPNLMMLVGNIMPANASTKGFALMNVFSGVAGFLSSIFSAWLMSIFNTVNPKFSVAVAVICFAAFAVVYTLVIIIKKPSKSTSSGI
ncbi:MAG: MFS transporter [Eubacteriaceae bacterium]